MGANLNKDGSISTRAEELLKELELTAKAMELRSEHLQRDQARLDTFMGNIKWMVGVIGAIIVASVASISFLGFSSISDIEERLSVGADARANEAAILQIERLRNGQIAIQELATSYDGLESELAKYQEWAATLSILTSQANDAAAGEFSTGSMEYAYSRISFISDKPTPTPEELAELHSLLNAMVERGSRGAVDANMLFNSGVSASASGLPIHAARLSALANFMQPSIDHLAFELQTADRIGVRFDFDSSRSELVPRDLTPAEVKSEIWAEMLALIATAPRLGGEQVYSRAQNIAVRNRASGYYSELIAAIETSVEQMPDQVTSYGFKSLAELYTWRGTLGWEEDCWRAIDAALARLAEESPRSSWPRHAVRELYELAESLDRVALFIDKAESQGVDLTVFIK